MSKLKHVHIVHVIIVLIFIAYLILEITKFIDILDSNGYHYSFKSINRTLTLYGVFKSLLFLITPVIAIFFKNKFSWLLQLSFFYFLLSNIITISFFDIKYEGKLEFYFVIILLFILIVPSFVIFILNKIETFKHIYKVQRETVSLLNLIAFIIGCGMSLILVIQKNSHYYENIKFFKSC